MIFVKHGMKCHPFFYIGLLPFLICCAICFSCWFFILYRLTSFCRDKFQNKISQQQQQRQSQSPVHNNNPNRRNVEVKKKVWSVDTADQQQQQQQQPQSQSQQQTLYHTNGNGNYPPVQQHTNGTDVSKKYHVYISLNFYIFSIVKHI